MPTRYESDRDAVNPRSGQARGGTAATPAAAAAGGDAPQAAPEHPLPELDPLAVGLFEHALSQGGLPAEPDPAEREQLAVGAEEYRRARDTLLRLRLLRPSRQRPGLLLPVDPETAAAEIVTPIEADIARAQARAGRLRAELRGLLPLYRSGPAGTPAAAVRTLTDPEAVQASLAQELSRCQHELLVVAAREETAGAWPWVRPEHWTALLQRGVRVRVVHPHAVRANLAVQAAVEGSSAAGGEHRTVPQLPGHSVLIDGAAALVPVPGAGPEEAALVHDRSVTGYLASVFEQFWVAGTPFLGASAAAYRGVVDDLQRAVVRLLAEGAKDEQVARRLGMSLRTCRRHIAEVLDRLRADSRFQAGVLAERAGLTGPSLAAPATGDTPG